MPTLNLFMRKIKHQNNRTKPGWTLAEMLIVAAIIGILAALALPILQGHYEKAKSSTAKDTLRLLRNAIEIYEAQHNNVAPGYINGDPEDTATQLAFYAQMVTSGDYLNKMPENPFNNLNAMKMVANADAFPTEPFLPNLFAWIYKPATKEIRLNWTGTDDEGVSYFDY